MALAETRKSGVSCMECLKYKNIYFLILIHEHIHDWRTWTDLNWLMTDMCIVFHHMLIFQCFLFMYLCFFLFFFLFSSHHFLFIFFISFYSSISNEIALTKWIFWFILNVFFASFALCVYCVVAVVCAKHSMAHNHIMEIIWIEKMSLRQRFVWVFFWSVLCLWCVFLVSLMKITTNGINQHLDYT